MFLAVLACDWHVVALGGMHTHVTPGQLLCAAIGAVRTRDEGKRTRLHVILEEKRELSILLDRNWNKVTVIGNTNTSPIFTYRVLSLCGCRWIAGYKVYKLI